MNHNSYKNLGQFRFWCQKVLPLVYDDSLSYYELLCKVVNFLNETIENVELMGDDIHKLFEYVNHYFDNLDVQNEINKKLDQMATDGSLGVLVERLFDNYREEFDNDIEYQNANIQALKKRMDTFTSLSDDSTTGDAELIDIRIGATGKTYSSAGTAVREQLLDRNITSEKVIDVPTLELLPIDEASKVIEERAQEILETLPPDYTETVEKVNNMSKTVENIKVPEPPISANNGVMQGIWSVVKSYLHHNDDLVYCHAFGNKLTDEDGNTLYDENGLPIPNPESGGNAMEYVVGVETKTITRNKGTKEDPIYVTKEGYCINCSTFVHLVLLGVPYEKSMYNPAYNNLRHNCINYVPYSFNLWGKDITEENYKEHMYTWSMAKRFRDLGLAFEPNENYSNLAPGDVVFFKRIKENKKGKDYLEKWVYHVGIVLAKHIGEYKQNDQGTILYTFAEVMSRGESVVTVRTITMDSKQLEARRVFYVGRPNYNTIPDGKKCIGYKKGVARDVTFDVSSLDLRSQDMVTLCFEYTPSDLTDYVQLSCNGSVLRRYLQATTGGVTAAEKGVTKRFVLPIRLSDASPNGYLIDDSCNKINTIQIAGRATVDGKTVNTNSVSNLSIWEGLNGEFINDYIVIE